MLMVLSPAKKLDFDSPVRTTLYTQPVFTDDTQELVQCMQQKSAADLAQLMKLSPALSELNAQRYASWHTGANTNNARQAVLAFNGDVYEGLQAKDLSDTDLQWAQQNLAILSGLYGVLAPLDLMQPYRLEMGTKLVTERGANLYEFWGSTIAQELNRRIAASAGDKILLNLASNEYFKSVQPKSLDYQTVECVFQDEKNGAWKIISFYAKKARGLMARYVVDNKIELVSDLKDFNYDGYKFAGTQSSATKLVFRRNQKN